MKKIIFLLPFFALLLSQNAFAQPTYSLTPAQVQVNEGDQVCFDLQVDDFTDIISTQFTITFDPGVITFNGPPTSLNTGVVGLDVSDFGVSTANQGYITFVWSNGESCLNATTGVTLPDGDILFSLCFTATGQYGLHTPIEIGDEPIERITRRLAANCIDIGEFVDDSFISIGTSPLKINIGSADGFANDIVCVDFKVEDFNDLISMQYYIFWDTSILEYAGHTEFALGNSGDEYQTFHAAQYGMLSTSWYNNNINVGISLPDATQILQMCFRIKGTCGQSSPIYISENFNGTPPEPLEVIDAITGNSTDGINIGLLHTPGEVTVNCTDPDGITVNIPDRNICPGESFCVDVTVEDFQQIAKLMFNLKWNPDVISYTGISYPVQPGGSCLPFANGVDESLAMTEGILQMDWSTQGQGCSKADGYIIMRLCFEAVGASGTNSNIAIVDPIFVDKFGGQVVDIGLNNNNSYVTICELTSPTIVASTETANPGTNVCVDFNVQDFDDITELGFTIGWEPNILEFTGVQGFNLAGLSAADFNTTQAANLGVLALDWANNNGISVPDGVSIFSVCFEVIGDPTECSPVEITDVPWPINVETTESNNTDVGLNGQPGGVCITNPFIFGTSFPDEYSGQNSTICVDLTVENFNQLTNTEFSINWDPDILNFDTLLSTGTWPNFNLNSYDDSDADDGNLTVDWAASSQILGTSLPNGTSVLQLCFVVVGSSGECSPLTVSNFPQPYLITSATTGNANLSINTDNGSVCVSGSINLVDYTVTNVSCGGTPNGAIDLTVSGGSGQYAYQWSGPCDNPTAGNQTNLCVGNYVVTITDLLNPSLQIVQPFNVEYTANATFANAGQDTIFSCGSFFMTLNGTGSSPGTYLWQSIGSGLVIPGQQNDITPEVIGGSLYRLTVTTPGCTDTDTVQITPSIIPVPVINDTIDLLTCLLDTVMLDGSDSPFGYEALWTGPAVVPGTETTLMPQVTAAGEYILTLTSAISGCQGRDTIVVGMNMTPPVADAGADDMLGCNETSVPIGGPTTSTGPSFIYDWVPVGGGQICGNPQAANIFACSGGTFQLTVTDTLNGCSAMDEVVITPDTEKPISDAGPSDTLNCTVNSVTLDGTASTPGMEYTWTNFATGAIVAQGTLTPTINVAGTYQLEVLNPNNGCSAIDQVAVLNLSTLPTAAGFSTNPISCTIDTSTLIATGSSMGSNFSYQWLNSTGTAVGTGFQIEVNQPGTYQLVVTNVTNTCTGTASVTVINNTIPPASNAGADQAINCFDATPTLQGSYDSTNPNLQVQWVGPAGVNCISGGNTATPTVQCPGEYIMQVVNILTGCVGRDTAMVEDNDNPPSANAGTDVVLACPGSSTTLNGSTNAVNFTASWTSIPTGLPIQNPTSLMPTVSQPGTYALTITSTDNGCVSVPDLMTVSAGTPNLNANAGADSTVDCINTTATLDGTGSTGSISSYAWSQIGGSFTSDEPIIEVGAGTYVLTVSSNEGCMDTDTVVVSDLSTQVDAVAVANGVLSCGNDQVELDGTGSSTGQGYNLAWTDSEGNLISSTLTTTVTEPGEYLLTVSNSANNCVGTASVSVIQDNSNLDPATVSVDYTDCASEANVAGNLPANTTGRWSSPTGATFDDPTAATTTAAGLQFGNNVFIWTLSLENCADYDAATDTIVIETAIPNAVNDVVNLLPSDGGQVTFNVLDNDEFDFENGAFALLPYTGLGEVVASDSGEVTFTKETCMVGEYLISYEICDLTCPDLCDEATLTVDISADPDENCEDVAVPNGITPNGDGVNDVFVFDILLDVTQDFPDNEIIIFNRWGDVVYSAKPYNNDWGGTNMDGKELPQATYYYILRLNIANGDILRGDVTLLK